jgi:hypothetical protein
MKKIQDHNVVYFSIWFIHIAKGTPQWPRFHIQCQNIQIATLIIITNNFITTLTFLSDFRLYIYQKAAGGEVFNYLKNASKSAVFWCYCKPFSIHSFLVLMCYCHYLDTLEHTAILRLGELVLRWSKFSAPWGFGGMPPRKCWNLQAQKEVCWLTESNLSQIRTWFKCLSQCLIVVFVVQWLSTLILTLTPLLTHPNPIRLWILFHFEVCRLTESNVQVTC